MKRQSFITTHADHLPGSQDAGVRSLDRALSILETVSKYRDGINLSNLALELGLAVSTVHRLLTTLENRSFVYLDKRDMLWRIGQKAAAVGANFAGSRDLVSLAKPIMEVAAKQFSETISLGIISEGKVVFIYRMDPRGSAGFVPKMSPLPTYCTSIGKAVLSASPTSEMKAAIGNELLHPLTGNTITSHVELMADLKRARESGYAVDNEENTVGLRCMASAVFDELQRPIAAVSVSEAISKSRNARGGVTGDMIRSVASKITRVYGGLELSEHGIAAERGSRACFPPCGKADVQASIPDHHLQAETGFASEDDKMERNRRTPTLAAVLCAASLLLISSQSVLALDKVVVSANRTSSNLPYYIAEKAGFFQKYGIETDQKSITDNSLVIAAMIGDQIEAAAAVLAIDGMNANLKKPGTVNWITMNAQNDPHRMEQFVIRSGSTAKSLADLKGAKIVSAPGLGNLSLAKAALAKAGLKEGDYQLDPMDPNQHINVLTSKQYDAAYTLEPGATIMRVAGVATVLQSGVIASVVLGDPKAKAYVGGAALTGTFITKRPDVAKRYAQAWAEAVALINDKPDEARKYLIGNTPIPENIVAEMPLILYTMVGDFLVEDRANMQKYADFAQSIGALSEKVDIGPYLKKF